MTPAIRAKLAEAGGNFADNILVDEQATDVLLGFLVAPVLGGCSRWMITFDAFDVPPPS